MVTQAAFQFRITFVLGSLDFQVGMAQKSDFRFKKILTSPVLKNVAEVVAQCLSENAVLCSLLALVSIFPLSESVVHAALASFICGYFDIHCFHALNAA